MEVIFTTEMINFKILGCCGHVNKKILNMVLFHFAAIVWLGWIKKYIETMFQNFQGVLIF